MEKRSNVIEFRITDKILLKRILREAEKEALFLYQITGGFVDPFPPTIEKREMWELGFLEL